MVIRWPITQLGWLSASCSVARARRETGQSRNGPPEAVMITRSTAEMSSPMSAWKMAECSLSTGSTVAPWARAVAISSGPALTRLSLLASARVAPCSSAFSPGASPAAPTMADITQSAGRAAASRSAAGPAAASTPLPASASRRSVRSSSWAVTAISAPKLRASRASRAMLRPPLSATT